MRVRLPPPAPFGAGVMRGFLAGLAVLGFAAGTLLPAAGARSQGFREFTGRIERIDQERMVVDNRMGDEVAFVASKDTAVEGQGKRSWQQLEKSDWVAVSWKMVDQPRIAYRVKVLPSREEPR